MSSTIFFLLLWPIRLHKDGNPGIWLAESFSTSSLEPQNRSWRNLKGSKNWTFSTKFVCIFADSSTKMTALASDRLIHFRLFLFKCWTGFDKTWQKASIQLPLRSLCFRADPWTKMVAFAFDWLRHFPLFLCNQLAEFDENWQEADKPSLCSLGRPISKGGYWYPGAQYSVLWASSSCSRGASDKRTRQIIRYRETANLDEK